MNTTWTDIRYKILHSGSKLNLLIGINVLVFLLINIPAVLEHLFVTGLSGPSLIEGMSHEYLAMPAYLPKLATRFWTPITYMFMHEGVFHILFNMLWLYWMGQLFEEYLGTKRIVGLYIMGGIAGALFYIAGFNLIPAFSHSERLYETVVVGASASVMAIVIATATLLPNYTLYLMFLGPVKLKWIAVFYVVLDFLSIAGPNAGGEMAHIGGAVFGFIYMKQLQRGNNWGANFQLFGSKSKIKVVSHNAGYQKNSRNANSAPQQEEIDRILDKISQSGYDSLNKQEKETLFRASNNH
ncbi:rhomboid family intramembrane serine protease [Mucilaginibacter sp. RS28]|uniref:Rhomboid family intramembrane serine protease n=1 Tax=Mucilaginibacter straminoryzae TaxID=2932774 RepID=A0A9X1X5G4_9SPHI|nr:rhomboid family intramembrane serine protease [Mucilaginibacter straminoryzae]MCJ8211404.1 rhomboid family intramembrane serine protease [Mucilaginibacter straminoryzae]